MKKSFLFFIVFISLNSIVSTVFAESNLDSCIKNDENMNSALDKIRDMYNQSKYEKKYLYSYIPAIELSRDVLIKASLDKNDKIVHQVNTQINKVSKYCEVQVDIKYFGTSQKNILLKKGLRLKIDDFENVLFRKAFNENYYSFTDTKRKLMIGMKFSSGCVLNQFKDEGEKTYPSLLLKFAAPIKAKECLYEEQTEEISVEDQRPRKSNSRGV